MKNEPSTDVKYTISLVLGNKTYTGEGKTAYEALINIPRPIKIISKGFLTIENGKRNHKMMLMPQACKRLFYAIAQKFAARQLEFLLK